MSQNTLTRIVRAFDRGTGPNGWDVGIMEEVWAILKAENLITVCPTCREERGVVPSGAPCPYEEWHPRHWLEDEDDEEDE